MKKIVALLCLVAALSVNAQNLSKDKLKIRARYLECPDDSLFLQVIQENFLTTDEIANNCQHLKGTRQNGYTEWQVNVDSLRNGYFTLMIQNPDTSKLAIMSNYPYQTLSYPFMFEPGDSLDVTISCPLKLRNASHAYHKFRYILGGTGYQKDSILENMRKKTIQPLLNESEKYSGQSWLESRTAKFNKELSNINSALHPYKKFFSHTTYSTLYTYLYWQAVNDYLLTITSHYNFENIDSIKFSQPYYQKFINSAESLFQYKYLDSQESNFFLYSYNKITSNLLQLNDSFRQISLPEQFNRILNSKSKASQEDLVMRFFQKNQYKIEPFDSFYQVAKLKIVTKVKLEQFKKYENRKRNLKTYYWALEENKTSQPFTLSNVKGKIVFVDFWFAGCHACTDYYVKSLKSAESYFKNNSNVVFISINVDRSKEKWKANIYNEKYTTPEITNVYTNGLGFEHPMLDQLKLPAFPALMLFDKAGNLIMANKQLSADQLIKKIESLM